MLLQRDDTLGLSATAIGLAVVLDAIYQIVTHKWIYPLELLLTATLLAILPYVLIRGPVTRIARWWRNRHR